MRINMDELSDTEKVLVEKLRDIWDDEEFIIGELVYLDTEEDRHGLLNFIESKKNITSDDVIYYVLTMGKT